MRIRRFSIVLLFVCISFVCLLNVNSVQPQTEEVILDKSNKEIVSNVEKKPNTIRMGVRLSSELFGKIRYESGKNTKMEGYCIELGEELRKELRREEISVEVEYQPIANDHAGDEYTRYQGLRRGYIDLECGPNTIFEPLPDNAKSQDQWQKDIIFSDDFYIADIKILLKKNLVNEFESSEDVKNLKIEVIEDTTTYLAFKKYNKNADRKYSINYISSNSPIKTRYEALYNLDEKEEIAFANDLPILNTILKQGYIDRGFIIYPSDSEEYLPGFQNSNYKQKYGIAFYSEADLSHIGVSLDKLRSVVNRVIDRDDLKKYLQERKKEIEDTNNLLQNYYQDEIDLHKPIEPEPKSSNFLIYVAIFIFLGATIYFLALILRDNELRRQFLSKFIVVIISLFAGLVPLFLALLD